MRKANIPMNTPVMLTRHDTTFIGRLAALALLAAFCTNASAQESPDELGRLFFNPERRQTLDRQRQLNIQEKQEIPEDPTLTLSLIHISEPTRPY